jgi:hypothetical protein
MLSWFSEKFGHDRVDERVLLSRYTDTIDLRIEPHPYHPDELNDVWDPLARKYEPTELSFNTAESFVSNAEVR